MNRVVKHFCILSAIELAFLYYKFNGSSLVGLSDALFTLGVLTLLLGISFFFGFERKMSLFQISGKSEGLKDALNASLLEQLGDKSKHALLDFPLGVACLALSLINLVGYFILL